MLGVRLSPLPPYAVVAQLVEYNVANVVVVGSNPAYRTNICLRGAMDSADGFYP
jgi:hypothetical protein